MEHSPFISLFYFLCQLILAKVSIHLMAKLLANNVVFRHFHFFCVCVSGDKTIHNLNIF